ncbi:MAG: D-alanine--D-alanine ligase family protein [bacterium]
MKEPETVAVICGGDSAEREVSLKTGKAVCEALESAPCTVKKYDTERDLGSRLCRDRVDTAFIALHGRGGEDGTIQALLEWYGIPYTGPGVAASALCMDKIRSKYIYEQLALPTADWFILEEEKEIRNVKDFSRLVVKPRREGSSLGMSIVEPGELEEAARKAFEYDDQLLVEEYVEGYEVTVGVITLDEMKILPPVGIRPSHEFFDYDTKYTKGLTEYDVPAPLEEEQVKILHDITEDIVKEAETASLCRVDFIMDRDNRPNLLEINTIPGLTATSLLPMAAGEAGISFEELVWGLVCRAREDFQDA